MNPRMTSPATIITGPRYTGSSSCIQNDNMGADATGNKSHSGNIRCQGTRRNGCRYAYRQQR